MQSIYTTYGTYLQSGASMRDAIQSHLVRGKLPAGIVAGLAKVHAQHYGAHFIQQDSGAYRFFHDADDTTSANRHEAATKQWNRTIAPHTGVAKSKKGGKRFKSEKELMTQREFVLKAFKLLTATDRKWVIDNVAK
jgi:hypothetical protein